VTEVILDEGVRQKMKTRRKESERTLIPMGVKIAILTLKDF